MHTCHEYIMYSDVITLVTLVRKNTAATLASARADAATELCICMYVCVRRCPTFQAYKRTIIMYMYYMYYKYNYYNVHL